MNQPHRAREAGGAKSGPSLKTGEQASKELASALDLGPGTFGPWTLGLYPTVLHSALSTLAKFHLAVEKLITHLLADLLHFRVQSKM